jgi:predicted amidohydrolase YtcJ
MLGLAYGQGKADDGNIDPEGCSLGVCRTGRNSGIAMAEAAGPERYRYLYPALHKAGATIIGGSDWDISSYNPFRAFQTAITRAGGRGQRPLNIEERIPLQTAIDAYTINAAYAMKQDATTGSLEVRKRADLVVLDRDILSVDPETIEDTKAVATYLDGRLVYDASAGKSVERPEDEDTGAWWDEREEARVRQWLHRE